MSRLDDILGQSVGALRAHKLRASLTILGLMMGVATLIAVMTIVQGANLYVESKIANLGTDVFQMARTPFVVTDWDAVIKALRYKRVEMDDLRAVSERCTSCVLVGASASATVHVRYQDKELSDISIIGHTANMAEIDTRTIELGRYFSDSEDRGMANVAIVGQTLVDQFFPGVDPLGRVLRVNNEEFRVVGTCERIGSVLGQEQDNFMIVPLRSYLRQFGSRSSLTINVKAAGSGVPFNKAMDEARLILRGRRHLQPGQPEDFFIGTKESYISLWNSISGAFFAVFVMVSAISAVVGGIVIMNVMLVSVTERTKEIGVRRAVGATQRDIRRQFLLESVLQCIIGGAAGILGGFTCAVMLRNFTSFPAAVQTWVAILGLVLSSAIGLFFGIYPATRAARLDPVEALRAE
ncbi:MAG TPA: ABC transporter permease [Terriglobales bacterium]|nr:ABC transporter permease [Terriglobales bacterium]